MRTMALSVCWLLLSSTCLFAQTGTGAAMPTDPHELYALMVRSNGLSSPDLSPWHIKVSYTLFDENGKNPVDGSFEEWWRGRHQYKIQYRSAGFNQTEAGTEGGVYRVGDPDFPAGLERLRTHLLDPLPDPATFDGLTPEIHRKSFGHIKLSCISSKYAQPLNFTASGYGLPVYC